MSTYTELDLHTGLQMKSLRIVSSSSEPNGTKGAGSRGMVCWYSAR